jgi:hypothetical protein
MRIIPRNDTAPAFLFAVITVITVIVQKVMLSWLAILLRILKYRIRFSKKEPYYLTVYFRVFKHVKIAQHLL